jgi:hypothetical protein
MHPRRLQTINQIPERNRFAVLAEGLELLADNVATLDHDATILGSTRRDRGAAVLRCFAEEEAAKVMILLDLARAGWQNRNGATACLRNFYDHLARGLYVRAYDGAPADLAEVRSYLDVLRQEYFLDGPMEVDWIFGNEVKTNREQRLYVDYIADEHGDGCWAGPADQAAIFDEPFSFPGQSSTVVPLVAAIHRLGLLTEEGLNATRAVWDGVAVDDNLRWNDLQELNLAVLNELATDGRQRDTEDDREAARFVFRHWSFPLTSLNLTMAKVALVDLQNKRERWLAHEVGNVDGFEAGPNVSE